MKIIKFFSFILLLSMAWVACKDNSKADQRAENTAQALENTMQTSKTELGKTIAELQTSIGAKIAEAENQLGTASEDTKADINSKLVVLRKRLTELENLSKKVNEATAEGWADFEHQATQVVAEVRDGLNKY